MWGGGGGGGGGERGQGGGGRRAGRLKSILHDMATTLALGSAVVYTRHVLSPPVRVKGF